tara:strand:- start:954 stop:1583 length:630 start_codon:yes stop_codon:yes gene_type:complete
MNTFTIITGSGRCGTSAMMQFFIASQKYQIKDTVYFPNMRAGYENHIYAEANALISSEVMFPHLIHNNLEEGIKHIKYATHNNIIGKSPAFFFYNKYEIWKEHCSKDNIQVILLKRSNPDHVIESAKLTGASKDWATFTDGNQIEEHYLKNISNLERNGINYVVIEFPRFIKDLNYLYSLLSKLNIDLTLEEVISAGLKTFDPKKLNFI